MQPARVVFPSDIIKSYKYLVEHKKPISNLLKIDFDSLATAKEYQGVKFVKEFKVLVPNGDVYEYHPVSITIAKLVTNYGCMAYDSPKRKNPGHNISILQEVEDSKGEKLGLALSYIDQAFVSTAKEYFSKDSNRSKCGLHPKKEVEIKQIFKTENSQGVAYEKPSGNIKINYKDSGPKLMPHSLLEVAVLDARKRSKDGKGFAEGTAKGETLRYGNLHEFIRPGSQISGNIGVDIVVSKKGYASISCKFKVIIVKPGDGTKDTERNVGNFSELLDEAGSISDEDVEDKPKEAKSIYIEPEEPKGKQSKPKDNDKLVDPKVVNDDLDFGDEEGFE